MKTRKLVLIIADVILLAVGIIQGVLALKDGAKYFRFSEEPDEYTIVTPAETIHLVLEDGKWYLNSQKYPVADSTVEDFTEAVRYIRALDKVGTLNDNTSVKYELAEGRKISVEVKKAGKVLRTLEIGKETTSSSQGYVTIDGGKDIYLASGNLRFTFDKTIDVLRDKYIWEFDKNDLTSAMITDADGNIWTVTKMGSGDDIAWNLSGEGTEGMDFDTSKVANWFNTLNVMTATTWYSDDTKLENLVGTLVAKAKIGYGFKAVTIEIYKVDTDSGENYYAASSETPYIFGLPAYQANKFTKSPAEFAK